MRQCSYFLSLPDNHGLFALMIVDDVVEAETEADDVDDTDDADDADGADVDDDDDYDDEADVADDADDADGADVDDDVCLFGTKIRWMVWMMMMMVSPLQLFTSPDD